MIAMNLRAGALALAAASLLSALPLTSAEAQYYPQRRYHSGDALAGGLIGGVVGGLAAGAIIHSSRPAPVYVQPAPVYAEPYPVYDQGPSCYIVRRKVWLDPYSYTFRRERVCE